MAPIALTEREAQMAKRAMVEDDERIAHIDAFETFQPLLAVIRSTKLGYEDHGMLTCYIELDFGDTSRQAFGGWSMDAWDPDSGTRKGIAVGVDMLIGILRVVGVDTWEQLVGKTVWALKPKNSSGSATIEGIASSVPHTGKRRVLFPRTFYEG